MKRLFVILSTVAMIIGMTALVSAQAPDAKAPEAKAPAAAAAPVMGKVVELNAQMLKVEVMVNDKAEVKEFALEKPVMDVKVGDQVKVTFVAKDGKNIAQTVTKAEAAPAGK